MINTDFFLQPGNSYKRVFVKVDTVGAPEGIYGPTANLKPQNDVTGGVFDNSAGRFGYLAFGIMHPTFNVPYFYSAHQINYLWQVFEPPNDECIALRIWLRQGVTAEADITSEDALTKIVKITFDIAKELLLHVGAKGIGEGGQTGPSEAPGH